MIVTVYHGFVPFKMKFESYADRGVEAAVDLINQLTSGWSKGRALDLPRDGHARRELAQTVEARISGRSVHITGRTGEELIQLAAELRSIFELMGAGRADQAGRASHRRGRPCTTRRPNTPAQQTTTRHGPASSSSASKCSPVEPKGIAGSWALQSLRWHRSRRRPRLGWKTPRLVSA